MTNPLEFKARLADAIELLYADAPIIGDPTCSTSTTDARSARGA